MYDPRAAKGVTLGSHEHAAQRHKFSLCTVSTQRWDLTFTTKLVLYVKSTGEDPTTSNRPKAGEPYSFWWRMGEHRPHPDSRTCPIAWAEHVT